MGFAWPSRFPIFGAGRGQHPFKTTRNYEDFLGRIDGFVVWMDTAIANMREGIERGVTHSRVLMERVLPQLDAQIVDDSEKSPFYEPLRNFPASVDAAARERLTARYVDAIQNKIVPAYRRLRAFIAADYLPRCRTTDGFGALPDGRAWYAQAVRTATTTTLTPEEIHEIGLAEVTRIRTAINALRAEITAAGEAPPPRHRTLDELLGGYARLRADVDAALPRLFGRLPRAGFEVRPIEAFRERSLHVLHGDVLADADEAVLPVTGARRVQPTEVAGDAADSFDAGRQCGRDEDSARCVVGDPRTGLREERVGGLRRAGGEQEVALMAYAVDRDGEPP